MIRLVNAGLAYRQRGGSTLSVLRAISLQVNPGEFVVILGPSGCGKSSILRLIAGLCQPTMGQVLVNGRPVKGPGPDRGLVFQAYNLFPWLSVSQNVEFGIRGTVRDAFRRQAVVTEHIAIMGLEGFEKSYPAALSGGMRQRVALARTLAMNPVVLLMDEPFGALDPSTRLSLQNHLQEKWKCNQWTILFVTHDVEEAILLGDRVLVCSHRPATIIAEETIAFERPRTAALRDTEEYRRIRDSILRRIDSSVRGDSDSDQPGSGSGRAPERKRFTWQRTTYVHS